MNEPLFNTKEQGDLIRLCQAVFSELDTEHRTTLAYLYVEYKASFVTPFVVRNSINCTDAIQDDADQIHLDTLVELGYLGRVKYRYSNPYIVSLTKQTVTRIEHALKTKEKQNDN